ncbi:unnamed protein product, partial [Ectocarpus sp. 12 AP-2014]
SPTPDVFRSEFLLIAMCADLLDVGDMEQALSVHISQVEDELQKIDEMKSDMPEGSWLADYGTTCMKTQLDWLHANRERILADSNEVARNAPKRTSSPDDALHVAPVSAE